MASKTSKYALSIVLAILLSLCVGYFAPGVSQPSPPPAKAEMPTFQVELRYLEGQNALLVTEDFFLKVLNENEVRGPRRELQTIFTIDNIKMQYGYDFISVTRENTLTGEKVNFPLVPNALKSVLELKIGDENYLAPGKYRYSLQYKILNPVIVDGESERLIMLLTPLPAIAVDSFAGVFYPPEIIEPRTITATAFILAEERDGEYARIVRSADFNIQATTNSQERNRFGEAKPMIPIKIPRSLNGNEYLWLDLHWPKGFVFKQ